MSRKSFRPIFMVPYIGKVLGALLLPFLPMIVIFMNLLEEKFYWDEIISNYKDLVCVLRRK